MLSKDYKIYRIKKPNGDYRIIEAPSEELKQKQKFLIPFLQSYPHRDYVYGLGGTLKNTSANAEVHQSSKIIIKMDIKKFFPNTTPDYFNLALKKWIPCKVYIKNTVEANKHLLFLNNHLPTGAPTSPLVASICFTEADYKLNLFSKDNGLKYTRYMDDLTFSGKYYPKGFQKKVCEIISNSGYTVNHNKSQVLYRDNHQQIVTGVSVNNKPTINKQYRRKMRAELDRYAKESLPIDNYMRGKLAYIKQINFLLWDKFEKYFLARKTHWNFSGNKIQLITNEETKQ